MTSFWVWPIHNAWYVWRIWKKKKIWFVNAVKHGRFKWIECIRRVALSFPLLLLFIHTNASKFVCHKWNVSVLAIVCVSVRRRSIREKGTHAYNLNGFVSTMPSRMDGRLSMAQTLYTVDVDTYAHILCFANCVRYERNPMFQINWAQNVSLRSFAHSPIPIIGLVDYESTAQDCRWRFAVSLAPVRHTCKGGSRDGQFRSRPALIAKRNMVRATIIYYSVHGNSIRIIKYAIGYMCDTHRSLWHCTGP